MDEHPRFATPSGLADNTQQFSPEKPASFTPPRGHVPAFDAMLSSSDQYLAQQSTKDEPVDCSNTYSPFAEIEARSKVQEEPVESLHYQREPAISFGDIKILMKVKLCVSLKVIHLK